MKYGPLAISFDYGTQSVRAILFDKTGETRCKVKLEFEEPLRHPFSDIESSF